MTNTSTTRALLPWRNISITSAIAGIALIIGLIMAYRGSGTAVVFGWLFVALAICFLLGTLFTIISALSGKGMEIFSDTVVWGLIAITTLIAAVLALGNIHGWLWWLPAPWVFVMGLLARRWPKLAPFAVALGLWGASFGFLPGYTSPSRCQTP
ncbi:hypothetical protein BVG79_00943 [Ketogulonicigenium robustum]|uniref:Uncharacterized protein n=1 Tax=Ketogulonicigenium robustum TaxID=92947 RepID=A0A1W6NYH4_9RHOB|nr:hypothetical protein [Ketogulonicigenium robustum]ARO14295.1 hypothetical protein BVG79_00943 [Ketogulonicigenium robustum]